MRILVVGNGAREHAIAWKLRQSPSVEELYVAPGNAGTAQIACNVPVSVSDIDGLIRAADERRIDLTVVGPEGPLAEGIADRFQAAGLLLFGPPRAAALIESSKRFAKDLMARYKVPTARARVFNSYPEARDYAQEAPLPLVVKADGLAAGKGVVVAHRRQDALEALRLQMEEKQFGAAGETVLIEECLSGPEVSVFAFVDGGHVSTMTAACDYKRVGDGDVGPNTGGMGSFSPPPFWDRALEERVRAEIMEPVARALAENGSPYRGVLYGGLMLTADGPKVVEFNCRLGDPETQVILPRLKTDLAEAMMMTAQGRLEEASIRWEDTACVAVVVASGGYPGRYETGHPISGLEELQNSDVTVFHAGTKACSRATEVVTDGGRVLTVASLGSDLEEARSRVYANIGRVRFKDSFYRNDIAAFD